MSHLLVQGVRPLRGEVTIHGAKNSALPILAATLVAPGVTVLDNCPRLQDVDASIRILRHLGCEAHWEASALVVDTTNVGGCSVSEKLMREMRSSSIFLGAILARCGQGQLHQPGGCELGPRPIDMHLAGLRRMGAVIDDEDGVLRGRAETLQGCRITLRLPSVGATENLMIAATAAQGQTIIDGAAREPEIVDLQRYLCACGASIHGAGSSRVVIQGGRELRGCRHRCIGDRIVAATYLCACAAAGGKVCLHGLDMADMGSVLAVLEEAGCGIRQEDSQSVSCQCQGVLRGVQGVCTAPFPGFPTDAQAVMMGALLRARGTSVFEENLFESRYRHVEQMRRLGAKITVQGREALVQGVESLHGACMEATDLRGGAAMCVAALGALGESRITGLHHIQRGYEDIARDLRALGASVQLVAQENN